MYRETRLARQEAYDGVPMQKGHMQEKEKTVKEEFGNIVQACRASAQINTSWTFVTSGVKGHKKGSYRLEE